MSSRLLTMKFMQRAAATSSPSSGVNSPNQPPSKRQRLSNGTSSSHHSTSDMEAIQAAIAEEELKRSQAIERQAAEQGETRWVLSVQRPVAPAASDALKVTTAGYADIDALSEEDSEEEGETAPASTGRMQYGKFAKAADTGNSRSSSEDDDEEEYDPSDLDKLIEQQSKAAARSSTQTRPPSDTITFTSISGGGSLRPSGSSSSQRKEIVCYKCNRSGHIARNCPG